LIIVKLRGGLGNQMFRYAAGRALALRLKVNLMLDILSFRNYPKRRYGLHQFNLDAAIARFGHIRLATRPNALDRMYGKLSGQRWLYYREKAFTFDADVLRLPNHTYLDGHWQSERYFIDASTSIQREFTLLNLDASEDAIWLDRIRRCCSVSLHVRRGDYVREENVAVVHGTCPVDYYINASRIIANDVGVDPHFFIFSDEPAWAMNNLRLEWPHSFVVCSDHAGDRDAREFRLMTSCKHHIIANSTFSWWGAWLGSERSKIVIAPKRWFASSRLDDRDLIPASWRRI
jgi:hypothetical protein